MARIEYPQPVVDLIDSLRRLPGIGQRSAERVAIYLLQSPKADPEGLSQAVSAASSDVTLCGTCGFFSTTEGCPVCDDRSRSEEVLCVVEQPTEVLPLERSGGFKGRYHCLGGKLSPLDGIGPDDLNIRPLMNRLEGVKEVIIALGSDVEGEATSNYLRDLLNGREILVTRIAQGLPAGGGLEYADDLTLLRALEGRR